MDGTNTDTSSHAASTNTNTAPSSSIGQQPLLRTGASNSGAKDGGLSKEDGPFSRFAESISLFFRRLYILRIGLGVYLSYKFTQWRLKHITPRLMKLQRRRRISQQQQQGRGGHREEDDGLTEDYEDEVWERVHERNAKAVYDTIVSLQGLWIKAGQYLSSRADVIPAPYIELFKTLQDSVPTKPIDITIKTICTELNISDLSAVFASFDADAPLATASIAQVHRAVLRPEYGGHDVVVKVQHHNINHKILQDLKDLKLLMWVVGKFEPDYDFSPIVNEWSNEVPKELDFINESNNTLSIESSIKEHNAHLPPLKQLHKRHSGSKTNLSSNEENSDPTANPLYIRCGFAKPFMNLTTKRVMVMSFIDGYKITDLESLQRENADMDDIIKHVMRAYAYQMFVIGTNVHVSNVPLMCLGNFLVSKIDGVYQPVLLDFGLTKRATTEEITALSRLLLSAANMDFSALLSAFQELGFKIAIDDPEKSMELVQYIFRRTATVDEAKAEIAERRQKRADDDKDWKEYSDKKRKEVEERRKQRLARRQKTGEADENTEEDNEEIETEKPKTQKKKGTNRNEQGRTQVRKVAEAFPGVLVFFGRVIQLLRGLCVTLGTRQSYFDIMSPFAHYYLEHSTKLEKVKYGLLPILPGEGDAPSASSKDANTVAVSPSTPPSSRLQQKLVRLVRNLIDEHQVLGVQIVVKQRNQILASIQGGVQGPYDPRPVRKDSLFPVFSCTKAITAACLHLLVQRGLAQYEDPVVKHWPAFITDDEELDEQAGKTASSSTSHSTNSNTATKPDLSLRRAWKKKITIAQLLSHQSCLQEAGSNVLATNPFLMADFEAMVTLMETNRSNAILASEMNATSSFVSTSSSLGSSSSDGGVDAALSASLPTDEPGKSTAYHALSFGWLVGGLVEKISGRKFKDFVREEILEPLAIAGEDALGLDGGDRLGGEDTKEQPVVGEEDDAHYIPGYGFIGVPPGVEARLANVHWDVGELRTMMSQFADADAGRGRGTRGRGGPSAAANFFENNGDEDSDSDGYDDEDEHLMIAASAGRNSNDQPPNDGKSNDRLVPPSPQIQQIQRRLPRINPMAANPAFFNHLRIRRGVIPAANGNFSARGLAEFYSHLVECANATITVDDVKAVNNKQIFTPDTIKSMYTPPGQTAPKSCFAEETLDFGLGFRRFVFDRSSNRNSTGSQSNEAPEQTTQQTGGVDHSSEGDEEVLTLGFGHSGMGGSTALCIPDPHFQLSIAIVINKLSLIDQVATKKLMDCIAEECGLGKLVDRNARGHGEDRDVTMNNL
ncbi:hypothetical protein HK102_007738 [Quaeritorhiza haematococci]|nr:hypothetical protein HK102_007738 [Quaeritorhiza haematococci]